MTTWKSLRPEGVRLEGSISWHGSRLATERVPLDRPLWSPGYAVGHEDEQMGERRFCYLLRLAMMDRLAGYVAPRLVYAVE